MAPTLATACAALPPEGAVSPWGGPAVKLSPTLGTAGPPCPLCAAPGGVLVFQGKKFRVIRAEEAGFPAFYRVVWTAHVAEFSELGVADRNLCMAAVNVVEEALRDRLHPSKINLAALGNVVPHLHWHVIARFDWDSHFPAPVWGAAQRPVDWVACRAIEPGLADVDGAIRRALALQSSAA